MSAATLIHRLASLLKETENQIVSGSNHLSLTGATLKLVSDAVALREKKDRESQRLSSKPARHAVLVEDVKYLQDFFSRAPAVKLQGLPENIGSGSCVDLTMFKSLQTLSVMRPHLVKLRDGHFVIKRVPLTYVVGLSGVREQCKRLSCQRCLDNIKDLLLTCGADNTGPLSWSLLVDLNLSYNSITELNAESMKLCLSVQMLDLSHNQIVRDETGLQYLPDLCTLNLAYNKLESLPKLNQRACLCLTRLILRNNNLSVIVGIECLKHLEDVDLSYNCLISHSHLSPLQQLNQLTKLFLSNNPLAFHPQHRSLTAARLSPHINPGAISLDGKRLSVIEKRFLPKPDGYGLPSPTTDPSYLTAVGGSPSGQTSHPTGSPQKVTPKSKGKGKAGPRPASIHENNMGKVDKNNERRVRTKLVYDENDMVASQKREEAEMLRRQVGDGWLVSYQENSRKSEGDEASNPAGVDNFETSADATWEKPALEGNSPKQPPNVPDHGDDEDDLADGVYKEIFNVSVEESDDEGHHVETQRFVCITDRFVVEKDNAGKEIGRLDRTCLCDASVHPEDLSRSECNAGSSEGERPVVQLEFDHTRRDRRRRRYILENSTQSRALLDILQENIHTHKSVRSIRPKYECLKCSTVFEHCRHDNCDISSLPDCPHCNSNHVVDRGSSSNGPSSAMGQQPIVSEHSTPVPFIELIRQSPAVVFDTPASPIVAVDGLAGNTAHIASVGEQAASASANKSFEDTEKTSSSPDPDKSLDLVPLLAFQGLDQSPTSVSVARWHVDDSLAGRDLTSSPFKHYRSLSQPWNDAAIDLGHYSQTRSKSQDNIGVESGAELQTVRSRATTSWSLSVREAYERQSSRSESHSHSTSRSAGQESLLGGNSIETAHQPKSEELSLQAKDVLSASSGPSWQGIDPDNCTKVHYRLRLYYDLNLFKDDKEFDSHFKCGVVLCNQADEQPGLVVLSNLCCFICTCKEMPNSHDECRWINVIGCYPFDCLQLVTVGLGKQVVRLQLSLMSLGACSLLFCDAMRSSVFISHLAACAGTAVPLAEICPWTLYNLRTQILDCADLESLTEMAYDIKSVLLDSTNLIQDRRGQVSTFRQSIVGSDLVSWLCKNKMAPDKPKACALVQQLMEIGVICHINGQSTFEDDSSLYSFNDELGSRDKPFEFFVLCRRITGDKGPQRTVALMATTDCLYLLKQNFHQPEPVKSGPLLDQFSGPQFVTIASEKIVNVNEMIVYKSHPNRLSVGFFESEEDGKRRQTWHLQLETAVTLDMVTAKVSELWKDVFQVNLQLTVQS